MGTGIATFVRPLLSFCLRRLLGGGCLCACFSGDGVSLVSTLVIVSSFGGLWSLLLGSSMAKKRPRPMEVLRCESLIGDQVLVCWMSGRHPVAPGVLSCPA